MWQSLHDAWWRLATQRHPSTFPDAITCGLLQVGSAAYGAAVSARNIGYDCGWARTVRLPCPVISVGNLTVGGTGKTTCVELVARKLTALGRQVAVLSRGYGGPRQPHILRWVEGALQVDGGSPTVGAQLADEPQWLAQRLAGIPIVVGRARHETGRMACTALGADALVLDDGFQHRRLQRNCDIVLVHARTPLDGGALLPRGPMREPLTSLRRAHAVIITKADEALNTLGALSERLRAFNRALALVTAVHQPVELWDPFSGQRSQPSSLEGRRVALLSSIGDPEGFASTVRRLQADIVWHQVLPDHHAYEAMEVDQLVERAQTTKPDMVVTTEKDWVRLQHTAHRTRHTVPLWVLRVQMKILSGEAELDARLACVCAR